MKNIAIIGATGLLGKPVTHQLISAGFNVTVITRNIEKAKAIFTEANIVYGDLADKTSLINALKGQEIVYLNLHVKHNVRRKDFIAETDGLMNFLEVAKQIGIKRIAYLSSMVKDFQCETMFKWWVFEAKQKAVQLIKGAGLPYTIFVSSSFMENFTKDGGFMKANNLNLVGKSNVKLFWISANDYAKQVVKSFELLTDENREYYIQGPQSYTTEEALNIFRQHYSLKKLNIVKIPMFSLFVMSWFSSRVNYAYRLLHAKNHYDEKFKAQFTWDELGRPTETIEAFTLRIQKKSNA
nr:NmrA family NAD(P)-binding protein [uncultured Pedobacter sp.]